MKIKTAIALMLFGASQAWAGQVSVSNYPLYLLSQEVTQGQADAKVLLRAGDVGHHGKLSPTAVKLTKDSQFVVWFGQELEQNIANTLNTAPNAIRLFDFGALHKKPMRDIDGNPIKGSFDPHIWLDPTNAKAIVAALTTIHSHANPQFKADYERNANAFYKKMDATARQYKSKNPRPYWAYHDAFQYLEPALNLRFQGALTPDHHLAPKASRFKTLQAHQAGKVFCLASQIPLSEGMTSKIAPVKTVVRQEDMSDGTDFVTAWQSLASLMHDCTKV